jgi:hypothetical protein
LKLKALALVVGASLLLSACSSRPRPFAPVLAVPPADQRAFDLAQVRCADLLVKGKLDKDGRLASAGVGAATGAGVAAGGVALATATVPAAGLALLSATVVLLPFAVLGGAFGMARAKRAAKEKAVKQAMAGCLRDQGFDVSSWSRMSKAEFEATKARLEALATPETAVQPAAAEPPQD